MNLSKTAGWARFAILVIPLFGLFSAVQLACGGSNANDVGKVNPSSDDAGSGSKDTSDGGNDAGSGSKDTSDGGDDDEYGGYDDNYGGYDDNYGGYDDYGY